MPLATKRVFPLPEISRPLGEEPQKGFSPPDNPTGMVSVTISCLVSITEISSLLAFVTYINFSSGLLIISLG